MLSPKETGSGGTVYPALIPFSALCESGLASTGSVPAECTVALGFKPTTPDRTMPLCDPTHHYLLTIRRIGSQVTVWKQGAVLTEAGPATGATLAEWLSDVLTELSGSDAGYYSRLMVVDSAQEPTAFYEPSGRVSGLWVARRKVSLSLAAHLDFADAAELGRDSSGNGNHWTLTGASQSVDTPTGNHAVLNPLVPAMVGELSGGNLGYRSLGTNKLAAAAFGLCRGAYYWEVRVGTAANQLVGVTRQPVGNQYLGQTAQSWGYSLLGRLYHNGTYAAYGSSYGNGDTVGVLYDADLGAGWFSLNGQWIAADGTTTSAGVLAEIGAGDTANAAFSGVSGPVFPAVSANSGGEATCDFGQNGYVHTPPAGALPLSDAALPEPEILDADSCHAVARFQAPASGGQTVTVGWDAEHTDWLLLLKNRDSAEPWLWVDTVRGLDLALPTETPDPEAALADPLTVAGNAITIPETLLTAGDDHLAVVLRTGAGFGIADGIGHVAGSPTVFAHDLGRVPQMAVVFNKTAGAGRYVYHEATGAGGATWLNGANALASRAWGTISATEFNVPADMVDGECAVYLFADSDVISVFNGIGNDDADGPFLGFRGLLRAVPFYKCSNSSSAFHLVDTERDPVNPVTHTLDVGLTSAEGAAAANCLFTASGIKVTETDNLWNKAAGILLGAALIRQTKYRNAF